MRNFLKTALVSMCLISLTMPTHCAASMSKKKQEKVCFKVEHTLAKLLNGREKSSAKMIEYVLEIKKQIEVSHKVRIILNEFFEYACEKVAIGGIPISAEHKQELRKVLNIKYANEWTPDLKPKGSPGVPQPLVYGFSLLLSGLLLQATHIPLCVITGASVEVIGADECIKYLHSLAPAVKINNV